MINIGVLGCGNMGGAILRGWAARAEARKEARLLAYDLRPELCAGEHIETAESALSLAEKSDLLLLALKPQQIPSALPSLAPCLTADKLLISIAAGLDLKALKTYSGGLAPVVRVMPNTPALVSRGIFGLCFDDPGVTEGQQALVRKLFSLLGEVRVLPENRFNAFSALSGCGPAYIYYFLDALAEAGVTLGFTREEAAGLALSLSRGSVELALERKLPLNTLREQVCSPGGTTIEAMNHLDRMAVRGHIIDAVLAAFQKGAKLA